jgi:hypothetical protein
MKVARVLSAAILAIFATSAIFAQAVPKKIRGYKVHRPVSAAQASDGDIRPFLATGKPSVAEVSLLGLSFDIPAEVFSATQSGKVAMITFHDFQVSGIAVTIEEYRTPFAFKKRHPARLPEPARLFVPSGQLLKAAWNEVSSSQPEWDVTGRALVFGKFRKYGMMHKRVVPVNLSFKVKNPFH